MRKAKLRSTRVKKDPKLCQWAGCEEPYAKVISHWDNRFGGRGWWVKVCEAHAEYYKDHSKNYRELSA